MCNPRAWDICAGWSHDRMMSQDKEGGKVSRYKRIGALLMVGTAVATAAHLGGDVRSPIGAAACGTSVDGQCVTSLTTTTEEHALGVTGDQLRAYLLSKNNALDTLAASRLINRVSISTGTPGTYNYYTEQSGQWTGFITQLAGTTHSVNEVHAEYTAHKTSGPLAPWTGIGGENSSNLIQSGIEDYNLKLWIEILPNPPKYYNQCTVADGDLIFSDQGYDGDTGGWSILIQDLTTGCYVGDEFDVGVDQSSCEYVMEIAGNNGVPSHVPTQFEQAEWWDESWSNQPIASGENGATIRETQSGTNMRASNIGQDGKSFSVD